MAVLLVVAGAAILAFGAIAVADRRTADRFAAGITVAGIDVSGLTEQEAVQRVWQRLRPRVMRPVRVRAGGRTFTLSATAAGVRLRLPATVQRAFAKSREGNVVERGWRSIVGGRVEHDEPMTATASSKRVSAFGRRIAREVERRPVNARAVISVREVRVVAGRDGRRLVGRAGLGRRIRETFVRAGSERRLSARVERVGADVDERAARGEIRVVVTVSRSERRTRLFIDGELRRSYQVAVGDPKYPTPLGRFRVQTMQTDPAWNVPRSEWAGKLQGQTIPAGDPRNPLVARWIGFDGAVGFHGTKSVGSLGQAASHGCVRMSRRDVIDLYRQVEIGTPVLVAG